MSGETAKAVSGWSVDTLKDALEKQIDLLAESLNTQLRALREMGVERDVRYQQRFVASQEAITAALAAAEKAVAAALLAADRAVIKSEVAADKRFEAVAEFRETVADQAQRLLPRLEAEQRFSAITEILTRLEKHQAAQIGAESRSETGSRLTMTIVAVVVTSLFSLAGLIVAIVSSLK